MLTETKIRQGLRLKRPGTARRTGRAEQSRKSERLNGQFIETTWQASMRRARRSSPVFTAVTVLSLHSGLAPTR